MRAKTFGKIHNPMKIFLVISIFALFSTGCPNERASGIYENISCVGVDGIVEVRCYYTNKRFLRRESIIAKDRCGIVRGDAAS
jgi:hypothetical protein